MGLISKIEDKLTGNHHNKDVDSTTTSSSTAHTTTPAVNDRTGTSTSTTSGTHTAGTGNVSSTTDRTSTSNVASTSGTKDNISGRTCTENERHAAPIVQERVHDQYEHIDRQRNEELHEKTKVNQVVQPVYDEQTHATKKERVDHGTEVHEHGTKGIGREAEGELARKREEIAAAHKNTRDESTTNTSARGETDVQTRVHNVEEVVPVLERDIYRKHEIVHDKKVVDIHHEAPSHVHTSVNEPISVNEYERAHGSKLSTTGGTSTTSTTTGGHSSSTHTTGSTTGHSTTGRDASTTGGKQKVGLGEKMEHVAEKVTHKDLDHDGDVAGKPKAGTTGTHSATNTRA